MSGLITRRGLIGGLGVGSGLLLSGCDRLTNSPGFISLLEKAEAGNFAIQRSLIDRGALAREFRPDQRSPVFKANGTRMPVGEAYAQHMAENFANWRLKIDGLVARPQSFSLSDIMAASQRTQITRHDCVEGWSAIGKWTGVPLKLLLEASGLRDTAKYLVFHCADLYGGAGGKPYYESIDLIDALHPQTIMAWGLNDQRVPVGNGAPLRLRVERQLGYKHAKYVERIEAVASLDGIYGGKGGYWEDGHGYQWYAGI
jgi:DMSO/TMAO reductase YedYZ molybdopterin-dependent catalytic subunit